MIAKCAFRCDMFLRGSMRWFMEMRCLQHDVYIYIYMYVHAEICNTIFVLRPILNNTHCCMIIRECVMAYC